MSTTQWERLLQEVVSIGGVRGAAVLDAEDGLVVHEAMREGLSAANVAALGAAVMTRCLALARVVEEPHTRMVTLAATGGTLVAVRGEHSLWLVAVTEPGAELGRLRLLLGDLAPELS